MDEAYSYHREPVYPAPGPNDFRAGEAWLRELVRACVRTWWRLAVANPELRFYAWYVPSGPGRAGRMIVAAEAPSAEHVLVNPEPIGSGLTQDQAFYRLHTWSRKLPLFPGAVT